MEKASITQTKNTLHQLVKLTEKGRYFQTTSREIPISEECYQQLLHAQQLVKGIMQWRNQYQPIELTDKEVDSWRDRSPVQKQGHNLEKEGYC